MDGLKDGGVVRVGGEVGVVFSPGVAVVGG